MDTIVCLQPFLPLWEHFQNRVSVHINCTPDPTPRLRLTYWRAYLSLYILTFVFICLYICFHLFTYWLEQMRRIEEHIQPCLSLEHLPLASCQGTKARRGCGWSTISQQIHIHRWIEATQAKNEWKNKRTNAGWLWPMMNWHFFPSFEQYECCGSIVEIGIDRNLSMFFLCLVHNTFFLANTRYL